MNKEEFKKQLEEFKNKETYIMCYRYNYDSARIFNDYLIDYINKLENALDKIKNILNKPQYEYDNIPTNYEEDILRLKEIIKKVKGE